MKRAAIYCRISGQDDLRTRSLESQAEQAIEKARLLGYNDAEVFYERHTGAELYERPILSGIRDRIASGEFGLIVCHAVDRLSRNPVHLMMLMEEFSRYGAKLEFTTESLDSTPEGKLISHVKGYAAEMERTKILERTRRGRKKIQDSGKLVGCGIPPYGYRFDAETKQRIEHEQNGPIVRMIFGMLLGGSSVREIHDRLTSECIPTPKGCAIWTIATIHRVLRNDTYTGITHQGKFAKKPGGKAGDVIPRPRESWTVAVNTKTPVLIDRDSFDRAQSILDGLWKPFGQTIKKHYRRPPLQDPYVLRGRVKCALCGSTCRPTSTSNAGKKYRYYRCAKHREKGDQGCPGKAVRAEYLESIVWDEVKKILQDPGLLRDALNAIQAMRDGVGGSLQSDLERLAHPRKTTKGWRPGSWPNGRRSQATRTWLRRCSRSTRNASRWERRSMSRSLKSSGRSRRLAGSPTTSIG